MQTMFFEHHKRDEAAIEVIYEILGNEPTQREIDANFDHVLDAWDTKGNHLGKVYVVNEFMVDYVHEAVEAGGVSRMVDDYVGNAPIGHFDHLRD